jgi:hypothetical protein
MGVEEWSAVDENVVNEVAAQCAASDAAKPPPS